MKIALLLPPISLEERYNKAIKHVAGSLPPIGLLSIATILKEAAHEAIVVDGSMKAIDEMMAELDEFKPDVVGIGAMTLMWPKAKFLARSLKQKYPDIKIIVGGVHASLIREKALAEEASFDAVSWGEGEYSVLDYVNNIDNLEELDEIKGMAFRKADGILAIGGDREPIKDLDCLPIPDRSFVAETEYIAAFEQYKRLPVTNIMTARGCPYKCIFCLPTLLGKGVRYRSPEKVIEEVEYLVEELKVKDIAFWDDTFTLNKKRVFAICNMLIEKNIDIIWSAQARADCVDQEMLDIMAKAGCWKLFYGVESLVQKNLDTIKKGETVEQIFEAVRMTKKAGIEVEASFIFGIPGETYEEGMETIRQAVKLDPDYAKFFCLSPYGELLKNIQSYGVLLTEDEKDFSGNKITFIPFSMTKDELQKLYYYSYRKFYFRPKMIIRRLKKLFDPSEFKKSVKGLFVLVTFVNEEIFLKKFRTR